MNIRTKLINAATEYDRKESKKKSYNRNALAIYLRMIDNVCQDIENGADVAEAIGRGFSGRLLTALAKAVKVGAKEHVSFSYEPVNKILDKEE